MLPGGTGEILRSKRKPRSNRVMSMGSIRGGEEGFCSGEVTAKRWVGMWASRETCILNVDPTEPVGTVGQTLK